MPVPRTLACLALLATMVGVGACDADPNSSDEESSSAAHPPRDVAEGAPESPIPSQDAESPARPAPAPHPPAPPPEAAPIETRRAERASMLYDEPRFSAAFRGKIARGDTFYVYEHVEGEPDDCDEGWGRLGRAAYVCLGRSTVVKAPAPTPKPRIGANGLTPFFYAKRRGPELEAPVWRSRAALRRGDEPVGELAREHTYAFVRRRWANGERILQDETRRVVKEADVRRFNVSSFEGRDLLAQPLPSEGILAWVVRWPDVDTLDRAHPDADRVGAHDFQTTIVVDDGPLGRGGSDFYPLHEGTGWVEAKAIRLYVPGEPLEEVEGDAAWIDIEISQQTLTLYRGREPVFATLIGSGTGRDPTPLGLYRMESKLALTDMRSKPGDDDAYHVEAVPWAMYFDGRYALHGAYWHNRFGNRVSHGCVNLSPKDAQRVFDALSPALPAGWISVYEHEDDLGSLVRVRKGDRTPPDRRHPPRQRGL